MCVLKAKRRGYKTLSPIEQEYLNNIKMLSEKGKKGTVRK
jgi:hypothetical protein